MTNQDFRSDGCKHVYRRHGEQNADTCVVERDRFGLCSVLVWEGITHNFKTPLVITEGTLMAEKYCNQVLIQHVGRMGFTFQQDNARLHVARICINPLCENQMVVIEWPPYSLDFSPIEYLWDIMDYCIRRRVDVPGTLQQLEYALTEEWKTFPCMMPNH